VGTGDATSSKQEGDICRVQVFLEKMISWWQQGGHCVTEDIVRNRVSELELSPAAGLIDTVAFSTVIQESTPFISEGI
jgi:predicted ABC-type ATPase